MSSHIISPTGFSIRCRDKHGFGTYMASRGEHRLHEAEDYYCEPGQYVYAPISGEIFEEFDVYYHSYFKGLRMRNQDMILEIRYVSPKSSSVSKRWVKQGEVIGQAQDITERYEGITPHVEIRVISVRPSLLM